MKDQEFKEKETDSVEKSTSRKSRRPRRSNGRKTEGSKYTRGANDVNWLLHNPELSNVTSRIPFGRPVGSALYVGDEPNTGSEIKTSIPGILTVRGNVTVGVAKDQQSPINETALNIWTYLRHMGTGSVVDSPNDVAFYLASIGQLIAFAGWMRRIFDNVIAANPQNMYTIRRLVQAEGCDYASLVNHLSDFAYLIQFFSVKMNALMFPKLAYFDNCYMQFRKVFRDDNIAKGQYYLIVPLQFGHYDPVYDTQGAGLVYGWVSSGTGIFQPDWINDTNINGGNLLPFDALRDFAYYLLNSVMNEQYTATLGAAFLKVYGAENLWRLSDAEVLAQKFESSYDAEALMQIHNAICYRSEYLESNTEFTYGYRSFIPPISSDGTAPYMVSINLYLGLTPGESADGSKVLFDCFTEVPSDAEVILASRYKPTVDVGYNEDEGEYTPFLVSHDVFLPIVCELYCNEFDSTGAADLNGMTSYFTDLRDPVVTTTTTMTVDKIREIESLGFSYSPIIQEYVKRGNLAYKYLFGTTINSVFVAREVVADIHRANILSVFEVPIHRGSKSENIK